MNYPATDARHYCPVCHGASASAVFDINKCFVCGGTGLARIEPKPCDVTERAEGTA